MKAGQLHYAARRRAGHGAAVPAPDAGAPGARTLVGAILDLDITGVAVVDSQVAQGLLRVVQAARLLGTEVVLVGVRVEVAQAIVTLGMELHGLQTFSDLQSALGALDNHRLAVG
jgi:STAS domain